MPDMEQVIYDIERCICHVPDACRDCSKDGDGAYCMEDLMTDALALLKEQKPVKPIDKGEDSYVCDKCGEIVGWEEMDVGGIDPVKFKYCPGCGRKVKWDAADRR